MNGEAEKDQPETGTEEVGTMANAPTCDVATHLAERMALLNRAAQHDEAERSICFPDRERPDTEAERLSAQIDALATQTAAHSQDESENGNPVVWSFDIDLTIAIPEDEESCRGTVPPDLLRELQDKGAIVGTCSDREPSEQRALMRSLGFNPDFCIPKEMLATAAALLPAARRIHVGDDPARDRDIARQSGFEHRWPHEVNGVPRRP